MDTKKILRRSLKLLGLFLIIIFILVAITFGVIFKSVRDTCKNAINEYQTDCVNALIAVLDDPEKSFKEKNDAIYTLGQLADDRALTKLKTMYTYDKPAKEPLDEVISQYELEKAIRWIEDGNVTSWMYFQYK